MGEVSHDIPNLLEVPEMSQVCVFSGCRGEFHIHVYPRPKNVKQQQQIN